MLDRHMLLRPSKDLYLVLVLLCRTGGGKAVLLLELAVESASAVQAGQFLAYH